MVMHIIIPVKTMIFIVRGIGRYHNSIPYDDYDKYVNMLSEFSYIG